MKRYGCESEHYVGYVKKDICISYFSIAMKKTRTKETYTRKHLTDGLLRVSEDDPMAIMVESWVQAAN